MNRSILLLVAIATLTFTQAGFAWHFLNKANQALHSASMSGPDNIRSQLKPYFAETPTIRK